MKEAVPSTPTFLPSRAILTALFYLKKWQGPQCNNHSRNVLLTTLDAITQTNQLFLIFAALACLQADVVLSSWNWNSVLYCVFLLVS